ncbi:MULTISPECIES: helix-turn-helix transcriptional regulator [unclassified Streptomyces]|uniref:ArsR/SmtB family transcription factor n=1 Tax=unclassified Streptomyces TaxID=2593676 RepID=UPI00039ACBCB|nr:MULTISPECIES: helix-turn-helix transcriptional regulator [unclassified Streptomyces]MYT29671.1 helix-turn-helix domain-containing protein [Streptomyces sp. SID8354]
MASRTSSPLVHPDERDLDLFVIMSALADPIRLSIVVTLGRHVEVACGTFQLPVAKSALSRHFKILRESGLIRQRDAGTRRVNTLRCEELDRRFPGLLDLVLKEGAGREVAVGETN